MNNPTFSRLSTYFWRYRWVFVACIVSMAISATTEPLFARLMKPLVDINFGERSQDELILVPIAIVGLVLLRSVSSYAYEYTSTWLAGRLVQDLRSEMFDHLLVLPNQYFDQNSSGTVVSKFIYDVSMVTEAGFNVITVTIKDSFTVICLLGLLIYYDWRLTIVCGLAIPFIAFSIRAARKRLRGLSSLGQDSMAEVAKILNEATQNQRIIKIFGGAEYEKQRFSERINVLRQVQVKQSSASAVNSGVVQMTIAIVLAIIVYYASFRAASGEMTAGDFVSYMTAMLMLFGPIKRLTGVNASLQKGLVAAESVFRFLDEPSEINAGQNRLTQAPSGAISFVQAHFRYPQGQRDALHNITLDIPAGKTVALVGTSGGGKTTLAALLPRLYDLTQGHILLDGRDIREMPLEELRRHIAVVTQDIALFDDTVANNIAYGHSRGASRSAIMAAAEAAHAMEFINQLPGGLDAEIGEKGIRLSGGQKQRLAIARAILKDAPILILDEATSALDNESERQVQAALDELAKNRTTLVIAHRLSTIERADLIVVMQHGQIVETGQHHDLLARQGVYANLYHNTLVLPATPSVKAAE